LKTPLGKKEEILHSAYAPFRMTKKENQNDPFSVTLRRKPKGLLWRFFPFASLRGRMTNKRGSEWLKKEDSGAMS